VLSPDQEPTLLVPTLERPDAAAAEGARGIGVWDASGDWRSSTPVGNRGPEWVNQLGMWSRGRRFKSCHPDGKQQVRGRFGQNPRRPLRCRVAIGVATAHLLTSPLLLSRRTAKRAPWLATWPCTSPGNRDEGVPSSAETVCSGTCIPTPLMSKALAAVLIARSALLGRLPSRSPW
jgi:hypothetical protein